MRTGKPKHLQLRSHLHVRLFFTHSSVQSRAVSLKQPPLPLSLSPLPQLLLQQLQNVSVRLSEPVDPYHAAGELAPVRSWFAGGSGAHSFPLNLCLLHRRRSSSSCRRSGRLNPTPSHRCTAVRYSSVQSAVPQLQAGDPLVAAAALLAEAADVLQGLALQRLHWRVLHKQHGTGR